MDRSGNLPVEKSEMCNLRNALLLVETLHGQNQSRKKEENLIRTAVFHVGVSYFHFQSCLDFSI